MEVSQYEKDTNSVYLGIQARNFLNSNIGKYLLNKIDKQVESALHNLRNVDPYNPQDIQKYQNDIRVAESSKAFLREAINEGFNAQQRIDEQEEELNNNLSDYADHTIQGDEEWQ
jgi:hypothetical protein